MRRPPFSGHLMAAVLCLSCLAGPARAHEQTRTWVTVSFAHREPAEVRIDVSLVDLLQLVELDGNGDARVTWGEVEASSRAIAAALASHIGISTIGGAPCRTDTGVEPVPLLSPSRAPLLRVTLPLDCAGAGAAGHRLRYDLFFDLDAGHRALVRVAGGARESTHVLSAGDRRLDLPISGGTGPYSTIREFLLEGFRHILSGYDHLAFLALLILPVAGNGRVGEQVRRIAGIVTAFTAAHSLTLGASIGGLAQLPAGPVEIVIAASVVVAAILNGVKPGHAAGWRLAFVFGLVHGFGFAGALTELYRDGTGFWTSLLSFNLGIEIGQLLVVAAAVPLLCLLSRSRHYRPFFVPAASCACGIAGVLWTTARF